MALPHPTEMRQRLANSNLVEDVIGGTTDVKCSIRSMPDPEDIYSSILGAADVSNSFIHVPNIHDGDGNLIPPDQYQTKMHDGSIIMVNVFLKL